MRMPMDDDGFVLMATFPDDDLAPGDLAGGEVRYLDPPPLPDSDWLAAVAAAVATPLADPTAEEVAGALDDGSGGQGDASGPGSVLWAGELGGEDGDWPFESFGDHDGHDAW